MPRNHRVSLLVLLSLNIGLYLIPVIISERGTDLLISLASFIMKPFIILLIGLLSRRSTERIAAVVYFAGFVFGIVVVAQAGASLSISDFSPLALAAVLLMHPVLERPIYETWPPGRRRIY